jgi:hypothetical protein
MLPATMHGLAGEIGLKIETTVQQQQQQQQQYKMKTSTSTTYSRVKIYTCHDAGQLAKISPF